MTIPWMREAPSVWDAVTLGGIVLPGRGTIDGLELGNKWDAQPPEGQDGALFRYKGYEPGQFGIVLVMWRRDQWQDWLTLMPSFRPKPGKSAAKAYPISHPMLEAAQISRIVIDKIKFDAKDEGPIFQVTIPCHEWTAKPAPVASSTPTGGWSASGGGRGAVTKAPAELAVKQAALRDLQERERSNARTVEFNRELADAKKYKKGSWY